MARHLNTNCDFTSGFFVFDIPTDVIQVVFEDQDEMGKTHADRRLRKKKTKVQAMGEVHPTSQDWTKKKGRAHIIKKVHDSGSSSDSRAWVQVGGDLEYTPKIFNDPRNTSPEKENDPMYDSHATIALINLNIMDRTGHKENSRLSEQPPNFVSPYCLTGVLKWPRCLCISESDWEDTATQHMPWTSSAIPDDSKEI